jgi:hypothetical protein
MIDIKDVLDSIARKGFWAATFPTVEEQEAARKIVKRALRDAGVRHRTSLATFDSKTPGQPWRWVNAEQTDPLTPEQKAARQEDVREAMHRLGELLAEEV